MARPLLHLSTHCNHSHRKRSLPSPTPSQQDAHTLSFRVTGAFMSHTYNPLQPPHRPRHTHAHVAFYFPPASTLSIRLSINRAQAFFIIALHFSLFFVDSFCAFNVLICHFSPRLDFGPITPFLSHFGARAGRPFFLIPVVIIASSGVAAEIIEGGRVARVNAKAPALKSCFDTVFSFYTDPACALRAKRLSLKKAFLFFLVP
jgi:hypothetical protein